MTKYKKTQQRGYILGAIAFFIVTLCGILLGVSARNADWGSLELPVFSELSPSSAENDAESTKEDGDNVRVTKVIDGDTIVIEGGEKVRFIGIDTPERGKPYYKEATNHLKKLIDGQDVRLVRDVRDRDRYGRLLRHVYRDDVWINREMIVSGYARFVTFPPDIAHVDEFRLREREARTQGRGIWR